MASVFNITEAVKKQELQDKKNEEALIAKCEIQFNEKVNNFLNNQFANVYRNKQKEFTFFVDYNDWHGEMNDCPIMRRSISLNTGEKLEIIGKREFKSGGTIYYHRYNISGSIN